MGQLAIIWGINGRLGCAFDKRLRADGYTVLGVEKGGDLSGFDQPADQSALKPMLFDLAYDGDPVAHVEQAVRHLANWRERSAIFIPSSMWIGTNSPYGRAKLVIEQLAALYNSMGAKIITDRIGYFPGDGVKPDRRDRFITDLVTGDDLYFRVMQRMVG